MELFKKLQIELYDPAILLLGVYLNENTNSERYLHPSVDKYDIYVYTL